MGGLCSKLNRSDFVIYVKTGDRAMAGTDANITLILHDDDGAQSPELKLDNYFKNDFETGSRNRFKIRSSEVAALGSAKAIEFWRDGSGVCSGWFLEYISVRKEGAKSPVRDFPVFRWVKSDFRYKIELYDTTLPQNDKHKNRRQGELQEKRQLYENSPKASGLPAQIKLMPADEKFSWDYKWNIVKRKAYLLAASKIIQLTSGDWESLTSLKNIYTKEHLVEPVGARRWTNDGYFAHQRVASCGHGLIKLCTEIPEKFGVTDELLQPLLEGLTLQKAIEAKRLFIVDLEILKDLPCVKPESVVIFAKRRVNILDKLNVDRQAEHRLRKYSLSVICAPIALFFENSLKQLVPIAIQLFQQKAADNPIFLPTDHPWTWLLAKVWYNNADASYHQALTHLGFTHLVMEGISVITHRNLSQSHPIFKLLAPHFLYLIAINTRGLELLISEGGWVDKTMTIGIKGMFELIRRGLNRWRMEVDGIIPECLKERGLLDQTVLHYFPYRDDALLLHQAIHNYVTEMVNLYYTTPELLTGDWEIQAWGEEMVKSRDVGGVGLKGVPGNGHFTSNDQLITVLTCIISTCSVGHAASNFPQYDEYAFPPNYPGMLRGQPPRTKEERTEQDIIHTIPDKPTTLDTMVVTKILSDKGTKSLGDFEVNYIFDPEARNIVNKFRAQIQEIGRTIKKRNETRNPPYHWLDPDHVPNSISI